MVSRGKKLFAMALLAALLAPGCSPATRVQPRVEARRQAVPVEPTATLETTSSAAAEPTGPAPAPKAPKRFDTDRAMAHVRVLAGDIGVRFEGSPEERRAGDYIHSRLRKYGYDPVVQDVPLPNGTSTRNLVVTIPGRSKKIIVLAAHYDSKKTTPGANDNASGVGVLLELARDFRDVTPQATVVLAFVGAEEIIGSDGDQHHFGARHYAKSLSDAKMGRIAAMISVDMVGFGTRLTWRNRGKGPQSITKTMMRLCRDKGIPTGLKPDLGHTGWSDHEPFEDAGVPSVWMQWRQDPTYHGPGDKPSHLRSRTIRLSGRLLRDWIWDMDRAELVALHATSEAR